MSAVRTIIISLFLVLSLLIAFQASSALIVFSDYSQHNNLTASHVIDDHNFNQPITAGCAEYATPSNTLTPKGLHGCCIGFSAVLPTAHFFWKTQGVKHPHQILAATKLPLLRAESIYRPPRYLS